MGVMVLDYSKFDEEMNDGLSSMKDYDNPSFTKIFDIEDFIKNYTKFNYDEVVNKIKSDLTEKINSCGCEYFNIEVNGDESDIIVRVFSDRISMKQWELDYQNDILPLSNRLDKVMYFSATFISILILIIVFLIYIRG